MWPCTSKLLHITSDLETEEAVEHRTCTILMHNIPITVRKADFSKEPMKFNETSAMPILVCACTHL